jgi:hypothetical protein
MSFDKWADKPAFDIEAEKRAFIAHLDELKTMSVEEQTLYKKWYEITTHYASWHNKADIEKGKIWKPTDIQNYDQTVAEVKALRPRLRFIDPSDKQGITAWEIHRVYVSSFNFDQNPGRFLRFMFEDEVTGKVIGVTSIASDVMSIGVRDQHIGWTNEQKIGGMLNHTAIGTTIVATQPFGFNFLGGKLLAAMLVTPEIRDRWYQSYGQVLAGITTTSLYGNGSMYNSIPWWKALGHTQGKVPLKPDDRFYKIWHDVIKAKYPAEYEELSYNDAGDVATGVKGKIMNLIFREVGVKPSAYTHGFERGAYFAPLYENTNAFLRQEITEAQLVPKKRGTAVADVMTWWQPKALSRYTTLHTEGRLKPDVLFYNTMLSMTWEEARATFLNDVGR